MLDSPQRTYFYYNYYYHNDATTILFQQKTRDLIVLNGMSVFTWVAVSIIIYPGSNSADAVLLLLHALNSFVCFVLLTPVVSPAARLEW